MATVNLTKPEFLKKVMNYEKNPSEWIFLGNKPALIDFYATWCGPCQRLSPILEEIATEYTDKVDIYKIDVDQEEELANKYGIRSVPKLIFVPLKEKPQMVPGVMSKSELKATIENLLSKNND